MSTAEIGLDGKTEAKTTLPEPWLIPSDQSGGRKPREYLPGDPAILRHHISKFQALEASTFTSHL